MFEFDPAKSEANRGKHGIDFVAAQRLWDDQNAIRGRAAHPLEERFLLIAALESKHWTAVFTVRSEAIRIISVRRSRENEVKAYGDQDNLG